MADKIIKIIKEIQGNYRVGYNLSSNDEIFFHLLKQIERHVEKLRLLKEKGEDIPGRFKREVADMYLLALGLVEIEGVDKKVIRDSADYYLNKVKENSKLK